MLRLSDWLGTRLVTEEAAPAGRLRDVVARIADGEAPPVTGLLVTRGGRALIVPIAQVEIAAAATGRPIIRAGGAPAPYDRQEGELRLAYDLLDGEVIDLGGPRVVRVNDVLLEAEKGNAWHVAGVDVGGRALLHRLLPRALRRRARPRLLAWDDLEILASEVPGAMFPADHRRLARLHPTDIARVADAVPIRQATEIVGALDLDLAADTMEEMIDEKQADVVEQLDPEHAADILERMAPDAAADVLAELESPLAESVLQRMDPREAADVHALLTYPKDTAGGLMTTDYLMAPPDLRAGDAATYLRPQLEKPDWIYYIYVVNDAEERRLLGVLTLRDLLLAAPDQEIGAIMTSRIRKVRPDTPAPKVAQIMSEYNLLALPVVDDRDRLLGIISVDDALEIILPRSLRRRLPHIFS